jgi:hypothetical protein
MPFVGDLAFGNKYEQEYVKITGVTNYQIKTGKFKPYDIEITENNTTHYIEVKADRMTHSTGNMCIEFMCNNEPSGITTTTADFYAYFEVTPTGYNLYKIPVPIIREAIANKTYHKSVSGGDRWRSNFYLFKKNLFSEFKV